MKRCIKILATADIHIKDYRAYSSYTRGIPNRLLNYETLSNMIADTCKSENIDTVVLAGDIFDTETNRPMSIHVAEKFVSNIPVPVILIGGNHDADNSGTLQDHEYFTAVNVLEKLSNVISKCNEVVEFHDYSFYLNWDLSQKEYLSADIMVGHGIVKTAKAGTYLFNSGVNPDFLSQNYLVSIIGDIHYGQLLNGNVLIPGVPIQKNHSDPVDTGFWIIDIVDNDVNFRFVPTDNPDFVKFYTVSSLDEKASILAHRPNSVVRIKSSYSNPHNIKLDKNNKADNLSIESMIHTMLKDQDLSKDDYDDIVNSTLSTISSMSNGIVTSVNSENALSIEQIRADNFLSTKSVVWDLSPGLNLLVGDNGVGKSTLIDSICYSLYRSVPRGIGLDEVINDDSEGNLHTGITLYNDTHKIEIDRYRQHDEYGDKTNIKVGDNDPHLYPYKDSISFINELVSCDQASFMDFIYFSQSRSTFLGNLTASSQLAFLRKLANLDVIDEAYAKLESTRKQVKAELDNYKHQLDVTNAKLEAASQITISDEIKQFSTRESLVNFLYKKVLADLPQELLDIIQSDEKYQSLSAIISLVTNAKNSYNNTLNKINALKSEANSVNKHVCFTCHQELSHDSYEELSQSIKERAELLSVELSNKSWVQRIDVRSITDKINVIQSTIANYDNYINLTSYIDPLKLDKVNYEKKIADIEGKYNKIALQAKLLSPKGLYPILLNDLSTFLNTKISEILGPHDIQATISTYTIGNNYQVNPAISITTKFPWHDKPKTYDALSGAERQIIDLTILVIFNNMYIEKLGLSLLILDEVYKFLGDNLLDIAVDIISHSNAKVILFVTHNKGLLGNFENKYRVYRDPELGTQIKRVS